MYLGLNRLPVRRRIDPSGDRLCGGLEDHKIEWHFITPGKPMQNGLCESFNGKMRDELLNEPCSSASPTPTPRLPAGSMTTTTNARIPRWAT
uniref:Integrase catalytic domain-containing protein n=1 Tax=Rhodopseudomonas palustris (strain BisA53) TaxID=316055 RepID=Q07N94_RHOP5